MNTEAKQVYAYRVICEHGKTRALIVDEPEITKASAREMVNWITSGMHLERVTIEEARKSDMDCEPCDEFWRNKGKHKKAPAQQTLIAG